MTQVKIFYSSSISKIQESANTWLAENDKEIINVIIGQITIYNGAKCLTISYDTLEEVRFEKVQPIVFLNNNG